MAKLLHIAGPVEEDMLEGDVQRCLRCDCVLPPGPDGSVHPVGARVGVAGEGCAGTLDVVPVG